MQLIIEISEQLQILNKTGQMDTAEIEIFECCIFESGHEISNNVVCATSKASDQPGHMPRLIRAFASRLSIL